MLSEKKQNYILEGTPKIGLFTLLSLLKIFALNHSIDLELISGLSSLRSCDQGTSARTLVQMFNC